MSKTIALCVLFSCLHLQLEAAKILGLFPHSSESHFSVMRSVLSELARREHNITVYCSHRLGERIKNINEIVIEQDYDFWTNLQNHAAPKQGLHAISQLSKENLQYSLAAIGAANVEHFLEQQPLQQLLNLNSNEFDYDLIIVDLFYTEALLAFGHVHSKPIIGIVNTNFANYMTAIQESIVPSACSPIDFDNYNENIGFWSRLSNIRQCIARRKQFTQQHYAAQEQLIRKHFKQDTAATTVTIAALLAELSVLLLNNHRPLLTPRPLLQNIVPAGGLHIQAARELPWHIKRFLDESRAGVIYMHLGNEQLCADLSKEKLQIFFAALGKRKERVLWTCHDVKKIADMPENILIQHAVPQTDILAHPHVRVFVMNGDLLSLQEGIVRHVPLLGLPIFGNDAANMALAVKFGVGIQLEHTNVSEASLSWALDTLIAEKQFVHQIRKISAEFRDRPLGALATTIFWVDYVLRHNDGAQLKTRGIGIASSQLHLFDLFIFYFSIAVVVLGILVGGFFLAIFIANKKQTKKISTKLN